MNVFLVFLAGTAFILRGRFIFSYPYPTSWDGFFYLQSFRHFVASGEHYYRLHYLFISFWGKVAKLTGANEVSLYYFIALLSLLIIGLAVYGIGRIYGLGKHALTLPVIVWSSNQIFHQAYGSLCEIFSFSLLCAGFFLLLLKLEKRPPALAAETGGVLLLLAAAVLHMFSAVLIVLLFLPILHARSGRIPKLYWLVWLVLIGLCAQQFSWNPKPLFENLNTALIGPMFALTRSYFRPYQFREFVLFTLSAVFFAALLFRTKSRFKLAWALFLIYVVLIAPLWVNFWDDFNYSGSFTDRLPQVAPLIIPLLLAMPLAGGKSAHIRNVLLTALAVVLFSQHLFFDLRKETLGPPMSIEALAQNKDLLKTWISEDAPVKAIHGLQYRVSYFLGNTSARAVKVKDAEVYFMLSNKGARGCTPIEKLNAESIQRTDCVLLEKNWNIRRMINN